MAEKDRKFGKDYTGEDHDWYDNFSHWATAVREIVVNDRFPSFQDPYIEFKSYPLGTSAFIYYCITVAGITEEWFQMLSQAICCSGMLVGLFALADNHYQRILCVISGLMLIGRTVAMLRSAAVRRVFALTVKIHHARTTFTTTEECNDD